MSRFIGLDVHKTVVEVCAIDETGKVLFRRRMDCTRDVLLEFAKELTTEDAVALEVTTNAWAVADLLEPFVGRVVSNPMKTKAIAEAKVKTDKVDAEVLAQLLRCDDLPSVWVPDATTRAMRQLTSRRERLVSEGTRIKNRIQSVLARLLVVVPVPSLFSREGQEWLTACELPTDERHRLPQHKGRRPGVKNHAHPPSRLVPSLETVCEQEGLPPAHGFEQLPVGEQRVLQSLGVIDYVMQIHADRRTAHERNPLTMSVKKTKECENREL